MSRFLVEIRIENGVGFAEVAEMPWANESTGFPTLDAAIGEERRRLEEMKKQAAVGLDALNNLEAHRCSGA